MHITLMEDATNSLEGTVACVETLAQILGGGADLVVESDGKEPLFLLPDGLQL
ncbi:hypothetical protein LJC74_04725 [Eubacteriales bacterium OttesenSCG-928-A19]|nr:hypothetical protein [Eubacteriales bacterium OttesenSCG-928-A19]